jgi:hypothetical protein
MAFALPRNAQSFSLLPLVLTLSILKECKCKRASSV